MAQITHTGNGDVSNTNNLGYSFTFPSLSESAVKVSVNNVDKTVTSDYTIHNWTEAGNSNAYILFTSATARGTGTVRIYRHTHGSILKHTFQAGSAIKANDLNRVNTQALYLAEEAREYVNNLALSNGGSPIVISGSNIADDSITTTKILDFEVGTSDLSTGAVTTPKIGDTQITTVKIADDAVTADKLANSINTEIAANTAKTSNVTHTGEVTGSTALTIANNAVTTTKIADQSVTLAKISNTTQIALAPPVGCVFWFAVATAPSGYLICNGNPIPNGTGTVQGITADFSALYSVIGEFLPHISDDHFIRGQTSNIKTRDAQDWKGFNFNTAQTSTYTHASYMGKAVPGQANLPNPVLWMGGSTGNQWGLSMQWDSTETRPKSIKLLPIIKY